MSYPFFPKRLDPFYIVNYYLKQVKTSWTDSTIMWSDCVRHTLTKWMGDVITANFQSSYLIVSESDNIMNKFNNIRNKRVAVPCNSPLEIGIL